MNTLAKIALGTVATGAVALAAISPVMAAPQTPAVDLSVATPITISTAAPGPVAAAPAPAVTAHTPTTPDVGHQNPGEFGCGIFTDTAANHLNDF